MYQNHINNSLFNINKLTLLDSIRQDCFDIIHPSESKSDLILNNKRKIENFMQKICNLINNELQSDVLNEIINDIASCFSVYPKLSFAHLNKFLPKYKLNSNFIIITALIISELTIATGKLNDIMIDSFVNKSLNAIINQTQKNIIDINLFGHAIPQQFKNNLIINLLISSKLTKKLSLFFLHHILPDNIISNDKKFLYLLQKMIDSSLLYISIDNKVEKELNNMILNKSILFTANLKENTLSFLSCVVFFVKNNGRKDIEGLNANTVLPFLAIMIIYIQNSKKQLNFSNKNFSNLIFNGIESLTDNSSYLLKTSASFILLFLDFIKQNQLISYSHYTKIISILTIKFFENKFKYDIDLILPYLFNNSFYFYSIFNKYRFELFDFLANNCSNIKYCQSKRINIRIFEEQKIIKHLRYLYFQKGSKAIIQSFHFLNHYCYFAPFTTFQEELNFLNRLIYEIIDKKSWDDLIIIENFVKKNGFKIIQNENRNYPNHILNILFNKNIHKLNIDELLSCILNETNIQKNDKYFDLLFNEMIKDPYIRCSYLEHLIYINSGDYIHCSMLLQKLSNKYKEYQKDFVCAAQKQFYLHKGYNTLYKKKCYKLHSVPHSTFGNKIITEIFNKINDKPVKYQVFMCLFNIAKTFPFLFYQCPQQAFESVLQAFDKFNLIYDDLENYYQDISVKNALAAMSFLFAILQFPYILNNFLIWFFPNILSFTNSQIYGFILILNNLTQRNESKNILMYILKYNFFEKIEKILQREYQDSEFKNQFMLEINTFISNISQIMSSLSKYEIIQIKRDSPISYMNVSLHCNNLHFINKFKERLKDKEQFLHFLENENENWLSYHSDEENKIRPSFDQINDFISKMKQNETELIFAKYMPQFHDFYTIKMIQYLVTKPQFISDWFLYGINCLMTKKQIGMIIYTGNALREMHNKAKDDPENNENIDCERLSICDHFKLQIISLFKLIIFLSFHQKNDKVYEILLHNITKNCELSFCFADFLFKYFEELSTNYDEINLDSMHNLIDLLKYLLTMKEYKNEIQGLFKYKLFNLAFSPKWRNDLNLLQKALDIMINYNDEFPSHIIILIKLILIENNGQLGSIMNIYDKLNQNQKEELQSQILKNFDNFILKNEPKAVVDYCSKLPTLINDKIQSLIHFLNKNAGYFNNNDNLDINTKEFLLNSFESMALHYSNTNNTELPHDFFNIFDKYNDLFNRIIKYHPKKLRKYNFLKNHPELISFNVRLNIFNEMLKKIRKDGVIEFEIDRNYILESSYSALKDIESDELLKKIKINFIDENGYDLGGLLRDWFTNLSLEIFNPNFALFSCHGQEKKYQPNKNSFVNEDHLEFFKFAGKIVARALIEGVCINVNFTTSFWKQILNYEPNIDDLKEIDLELYNSLQSLINNDVNSLCLSFTSSEDEFGSYLSIPLKENGNQIDVTNENKNEYIQLFSNFAIKGSIHDQVNAFCEGFHSLLSYFDIRIFTPKELNMLIGGSISIDVNDFRNNTEYEFPYTSNTHVVKLFFDVISKWSNEKLSKLLLFITGSSRLPINGFKGFCEMNGPIIIAPGGEKNLLPQAHTCFNTIDLPKYETEKELNEKLSMAIENCNSFDFI